MIHAVVFLASLSIATAGVSLAPTKKVSAAVRDTSVNGLEGTNLVLNAPFKIDEYLVGFKYSLAKLEKLELPDVVFARRDFNDVLGGKVTVQADVDLSNNDVAVAALWTDGKYNVTADGNTVDRLTNVGAGGDVELGGQTVNVAVNYNILNQVTSGRVRTSIDDATATVSYDTEAKNAVLTVEKPIDAENIVIPQVSQDGKINVGYLRKWEGGSLKTTFHPDDKVVLEWKDNGVNGVWTTAAEVPINNRANTKITFARDWNY